MASLAARKPEFDPAVESTTGFAFLQPGRRAGEEMGAAADVGVTELATYAAWRREAQSLNSLNTFKCI